MITTNYAGNAFSQDFIDAVNAQMVEYDAKLYDNGSPVDCSIMRMTLTLGGCSESDGGFQIGEVYASSLTATLHGLSGSLTGHELDVVVGVNTGSAYEYTQVATVVVTSSKAKGGFTSIQAAGKLAYACTNVPIGTSGELTPAEVAAAILAASGIPVTIGQFASTTTVTVTEDMTCRAVLAATAKRLGGYACETNAGGAAVMPFSSTPTYTLDPEDMTRYPDLEESDYTVDGITVQAAEDEYTFGTGRVAIADANATAETAAVTWGNVSGYSFRQGSANTAILDPRVTPFDVLTIGSATMPARGISATYDGGYFGVFSALGLTDEGEAAHFKGAIAEQVDAAERAANEAKVVAEATSQHFWAADDGAHVTGPETEDGFLAAQAAGFPDLSDSKPYHNLLMNSLGILLRSALNNLVSITRSAIAFFDGSGNGSGNIIASFGAGGAQLGKSGSAHFTMDASSLAAYDSSAAKYFEVNANGLTFGPNAAATTSQVTEAVDAIQVGGTNLLRTSGEFDGVGYWIANESSASVALNTTAYTFPILRCVNSVALKNTYGEGVVSLVQGETYVYHAMIRFNASGTMGSSVPLHRWVYKSATARQSGASNNAETAVAYYVDTPGNLTITAGKWHHLVLVFEAAVDASKPYTTFRPFIYGSAVDLSQGYDIKWVKLEAGNKPTDWSPAPEDVDAAVDGAAKTATNYISADSSGIRIANANPATATTYQHQTATKTEFVANGDSVAQFGADGARIGNSGSTHVGIEPDSMYITNYDGTLNVVEIDGAKPSLSVGSRDSSDDSRGNFSATFGTGNTATVRSSGGTDMGVGAVSQGIDCKALGNGSLAGGNGAKAGANAFAHGYHVTAASDNQAAVGAWNANNSNNLFEVGNGNASTPSNAFAVSRTGDIIAPLQTAQWAPISTYTDTVATVRRFGHLVYITGSVNLKSALTTRTAVATIPTGYRPVAQSYGRDNTNVLIVVETNGQFKLEATNAGTHYFSIMYMAA